MGFHHIKAVMRALLRSNPVYWKPEEREEAEASLAEALRREPPIGYDEIGKPPVLFNCPCCGAKCAVEHRGGLLGFCRTCCSFVYLGPASESS